MSSVTTPQRPVRQQPTSSAKQIYLVLYNAVSSVFWGIVLFRTASTLVKSGANYKAVYPAVGEWTKWLQTLALAEVGHALFGIVRSPVATTALQVASRCVLVWGVVDRFPTETGSSPAYASMLLAWSLTEVVRYGYFVFNLMGGRVPAWLIWARYNMFFMLYPMGISSEMWLVYRAIQPAEKIDPMWRYVGYAVLGIYFPGSYVLYTHMMAQRRRVMRGKQRVRD